MTVTSRHVPAGANDKRRPSITRLHTSTLLDLPRHRWGPCAGQMVLTPQLRRTWTLCSGRHGLPFTEAMLISPGLLLRTILPSTRNTYSGHRSIIFHHWIRRNLQTYFTNVGPLLLVSMASVTKTSSCYPSSPFITSRCYSN